MAEYTAAKVIIPPKSQPQQKKKKKNAPDKPQPAWLFPPEDKNPVLHPKAKTDEMLVRETQERGKALDYMKRRVHGVPDRPAPSPQLLTLIGIFLTNYGFNSTSRIFTNERKARQELDGWEDAIGKKTEKGTPTLEHIYREWYREFKIKQKDETSSSSSGSESGASSGSDSGAELLAKSAVDSSTDDDSEASSDGLDGSGVEMKRAPKAKKGKPLKKLPASSSSSSTSDSDADDEEEKHAAKSAVSKKAGTKPATSKPTVGAMINNLKRKAASDSSDSSTSSSTSSSEAEKLPAAKKAKTAQIKTNTADTTVPAAPKPSEKVAGKAVSSDSSSDSSDSDSDSESPASSKKSNNVSAQDTKLPSSEGDSSDSSSESDAPAVASKTKLKTTKETDTQPKVVVSVPLSDSSATINGDSKKPSASNSSASDSSSATSSDSSDSEAKVKVNAKPKKVGPPKQKKKHEGAKPTPLASSWIDGADESYVDNTYQSYEYADRAYKDLSVTRGKGFTKEKNKKKRGSYRGGAIDTAGGKAFKFED